MIEAGSGPVSSASVVSSARGARRGWVRGLAALSVAAALLLPGVDVDHAHAQDGEPETALEATYVRTSRDPAHCLTLVVSKAEYQNETTTDGAVLVVLDTLTFSQPDDVDFLERGFDYSTDVERWVAALAQVAAKSDVPYAVTHTMSEKIRAVSARSALDEAPPKKSSPGAPAKVGKWGAALTKELESARAEWPAKGAGGRAKRGKVSPAHEELGRLLRLAQTPGFGHVVLVTSAVPPETWIARDGKGPTSRSLVYDRLLDEGEYWNAEAAANACRKAGATLSVIAPEARFGEDSAVVELPQMPWASRPRVPAPSGPPQMPDEAYFESQRKRLLAEGMHPAQVEAHLRELRQAVAEFDESDSGPVRFDSSQAKYFDRLPSGAIWSNNDAPSGFGYWDYARTVALSGGAYAFYPFPSGRFLDACPRDDALLSAAAPDLEDVRSVSRTLRADPATRALAAAQELVEKGTPWEFGETEGRGAKGRDAWFSFDGRGAKWLSAFSVRSLPGGVMPETGSEGRWPSSASKRLLACAAKHDQAVDLLDKLVADDARWQKCSRRSQANVRLARYWLEANAFHLEAVALLMRQVDEDPSKMPAGYVPAHTTAIRMSDCLPAYDGRRITDAVEATKRLTPEERAKLPATQENLLDLPEPDEDYRAQRELDAVLERLHPSLLPRAHRAIQAARTVMEHDARGPWGWTTYYSELETYLAADPRSSGSGNRPGEEDSRPGGANTGSGGGGPSTK